MAGLVAYLARGNGYGHAAMARLILAELPSVDPSLDVALASTGSGSAYLKLHGMPHHDLGIADADDHSQAATERISAYLQGLDDLRLVVVNELFRVPAVCSTLGVPCLFISCFLGADEGEDPRLDVMLMTADRILISDWRLVHAEPPPFLPEVSFTAPLVELIGGTKSSARHSLGLDPDAFLGVATMGALRKDKIDYQRDAMARFLQTWAAFAPEDARLLVLENDLALGSVRGVEWIGLQDRPSDYFRAADVVFSAPGSAMLKLARAGIPTVVFDPPWASARNHLGLLSGRSSVRGVSFDDSIAEVWAAVEAARADATAVDFPGAWGDPREVAKLIAEMAR